MNYSKHPLPTSLTILVVLLLVGCKRQSERVQQPVANPASNTNLPIYQVKGVLKGIRAGGSKVLIAHEDIPGYMEAVTMLFAVKDTNELRGLLPGDQQARRF